jgi:hypothetical protein
MVNRALNATANITLLINRSAKRNRRHGMFLNASAGTARAEWHAPTRTFHRDNQRQLQIAVPSPWLTKTRRLTNALPFSSAAVEPAR